MYTLYAVNWVVVNHFYPHFHLSYHEMSTHHEITWHGVIHVTLVEVLGKPFKHTFLQQNLHVLLMIFSLLYYGMCNVYKSNIKQ